MASSDTRNYAACFRFPFKVGWNELATVADQPITKHFITTYKNIPFNWRAVLSVDKEKTEPTKFGFHIFYDGGPEIVSNMSVAFQIGMVLSDGRYSGSESIQKYKPQRGVGAGWDNFEYRDVVSYLDYGVERSDLIHFYVEKQLFLPWQFNWNFGDYSPSSDMVWTNKLQQWFDTIEDCEKAVYSNAKLIAKDNVEFYCDKAVLGMHSDVFAAMFRHPPAEGKKENEYEFPEMSGDALKALLEYIYTGRIGLEQLSTSAVIELGDAAEQHDFKRLLRDCGLSLWNRAVNEPKNCPSIAAFGELHDGEPMLACLKGRAFDVLAENYEQFADGSIENMFERSVGGARGGRLIVEFNLFNHRRVQSYFVQVE